MHKTLEESQALITEIRGLVRDEYRGQGKVVIAPFRRWLRCGKPHLVAHT